jgi:hypothetical protein
MNSSSDKKQGRKDDEKRTKPSTKSFDKYSHKRQGKMNPKDPFSKITVYESDSDSEGELSQVSDNEQGMAGNSQGSINNTYYNVLLTCLKNKAVLAGVDFIWVMSKLQGKGAKSLKGSELKRHLSWKECKMIISKLSLGGACLKPMEPFLKSSKIHLTSNIEYVEISSDIVSEICKILTNVCGMENVDHGVMAEYFNRRVADLRNRRNYEAG